MKIRTYLLSGICASSLMTAFATPSHAAGFALIEQSGSGMGNAYAGAAAVAEDASTIFFNPAGMSYLPDNQLVIAAHAIGPSAEFSNTGSTAPALQSLGSGGGDAGSWAFVPNFYFAKSVSDNVKLGIGVNAPFGLKTEYNNGWEGRFQALKSELKTINVNPALSLRVNDALSVGVGVNWQRISADLTSAANFVTSEGASKFKGDDQSWGWNMGAILNLSPDTRIGASYRSAIDYTLSGNVLITTATGTTFRDTPVHADITMPDIYSISMTHRVDPQWELLGDYTYTRWNKIKTIKINRADSGILFDTLNLNFDNAYRASLGANYNYSDQIKLRFGVAFDQSPVKDATRTARLPDSNRTWLALGANYKVSPQSMLEFGYAHLFMKDGSISDMRGVGATPTSKGNLVGEYDNHVDILSVQYSHTF